MLTSLPSGACQAGVVVVAEDGTPEFPDRGDVDGVDPGSGRSAAGSCPRSGPCPEPLPGCGQQDRRTRERRIATWGRTGFTASSVTDHQWQRVLDATGQYDMTTYTSLQTPEERADTIRERLDKCRIGPPVRFGGAAGSRARRCRMSRSPCERCSRDMDLFRREGAAAAAALSASGSGVGVAIGRPEGKVRVSGSVRGATRADLEDVFRREYQRVVGVAARVLGSRDQAEDVAQEVFLSFGRSSIPAGTARGWLCVAAAHRAEPGSFGAAVVPRARKLPPRWTTPSYPTWRRRW